jgi:hypothetical protein
VVYYNNNDNMKIQVKVNTKILLNNRLILIQVNLGLKWTILNLNSLMEEMFIIQIHRNVVNYKREINDGKEKNK